MRQFAEQHGAAEAEKGPGSRRTYPSAADSLSFGYDLLGRRTAASFANGSYAIGYDLDNRLKSAAKTGLSATLAYDAEGRLRQTTIGGTTTNLAYDGTDLIAEYNSAGSLLRRYVHGPGIDAPLVVYEGSATTNKTWLYADHLGSIVAQASSAGTRTALYRYGPFGEPDVTTGQRFRYTGQQLIGALGLYHYKARFYSPSLGRFLQTDPIGYQDDLNLYAYAGNSPISFNDPSGLLAADAAKLAGKLGEAVDDYVQGGYGRQFAQAVQDGDTSAALTYFAASFLSIGMTVESGGSSSALRGVAQSAAKGMPLVGGGAKLENLTAQEIARIQNAANRTGTEISVVGSRAKGTPGPLSDWDYVVPEATGSRTIHSLRSSLPEGPRSLGEPRNQDFFRSLVDPTKPFITFTPQ